MEEAAANMMNYIRRTLTGSASPIFFFFFVLSCSSPLFCAARDTITADQPILDGQQGETLVSAGGRFEMGFFTPGNSTNKRYLGIWYHDVSPQTFVWIANRNRAIPNRTGVFTIEDGELRLRDKPGGYILWSPTMKGSTTLVNTTATLLDSGNLILTGGVDGGQNGSLDPIWQSFVDDVDHPSDTFLPGMTLEGGRILRAWSDESDPTPGSFSFQRDGSTFYQLSITNESTIYWKSGGYFNAPPVPILVVSLLSNFSSTANRSTNNTKSWYRNINNDSTKPDYTTRLVIDPSGQIKYLTLKDDVWNLVWSEPNDKCSVYKACGAFGVCNNENKPTCTCLPGFEPQKPEEWGSGKYSGGCKRKTEGCGNVFINLNIVKVKGPESSYADAKNEMDCKQECRDKCCNAYFFEPPLRPDIKGKASSCWIWSEDENIKDLQVDYSGDSRRKLHILVSSSDLELPGKECEPCGSSLIPYPLSTGTNCGDPAYFSFYCNNSTNQLFFNATKTTSYAVAAINPETRTFLIQPHETLCGSQRSFDKDLRFPNTFYLTNSNTLLFLNCSGHVVPPSFNCTSSNPCYRFMKETPSCLNSERCCSYTSGNLSSNLNGLSVLSNECSDYTGIVNSYISSPVSSWVEGMEIGWKPPAEPPCHSDSDCKDWPSSKCRLRETATRDRKRRCFCNPNFHWDPLTMSCISPGVATPKEPDHSASSAKRRYLTVFISIAAGVVLSCTVIFICCLRRMAKTKGHRERENSAFQLAALGQHPTDIINPDKFGKDEKRGIDVPFFHYKRIAASTENFSDSNKLGEGGFGLVYKGQLPGGQEIAVKRLSKNSGQGLEEFKNEVLLIAKLQHRNLVRLLGYSVKGDEKMLLYEYMPNKSLDSFIFDRTRRLLLNWQRRFNIILGIARGLLYLHQDSRLRIIHRDLKTSNILLDEEMNPKISDFGLARIFGGNQIEANTNRVVGTYGYMSPEYALDGFFSIKSDVFSFGVVLLEIISGKKNTGFYQTDKSLSLLGYAWKLWQEDKALDLMDRSLRESCNTCEVMKCINVGLLCVQEEADDRPTMSNVVFMLGRETATLAIPKQPAFIVKRVLSSSTSSSSSRRQTSSNNQQITITMEGR
ncbi:PREDICTED: G-type lectin S-receptor-like serine/threonine-protein kinase At4g03230 isoform X1 [Nelumbo nucifera]|uniref:non-specific serine/threonine protein kinase n=2 Tax=Nelumbo nucifera TaxID=4432 RepID=A0A822XVV3_NELNU|nr:PREDICTED: G-type lectin S-receptor-like serine/threonine-protein kinase At4g03230 isoform X1 [Nelumbo nucifera]DAD23126.1 TPA_asm: hypothetical protein HUJ06_024589 [Nelumbo nucifera]